MSFFIFVFLNIIKDMTCCWCLCRFCVSCLSEAPLPLRPVSDLSAVMTIKAGAGGVGGPVASLLESPLHCSRPACPELLTSCAFRQLMLQMKLCSGPTPEMLPKPINKNPLLCCSGSDCLQTCVFFQNGNLLHTCFFVPFRHLF